MSNKVNDEYKRNIVMERPKAGGRIERTLNITKKDGSKIHMDDIQELNDYAENFADSFMIRALGPARWSTLKGFDDNINLQGEDDY